MIKHSRAANSPISCWIIQAFMIVLVTCKNKEDPLKLKVLEWSQNFSHCKSAEIFTDAQGLPTQQSFVVSGRNSNSPKTLWLSS